MTPKPLRDQEIIQNIGERFRVDFEHVQSTMIQPNESIYIAYPCSISIPGESDGEYDTSTGQYWGYVLFTTWRRILVGYRLYFANNSAVYYRRSFAKSFWGAVFQTRTDNRRYVLDSQVIFTEDSFKRGRIIKEWQLANIDTVKRTTYPVNHKNDSFEIMEFQFGNYCVAFSMEHGQQVYDTLQLAIQNKGKISSPNSIPKADNHDTENKSSLVDKLKQLSELHSTGILTNEEFQLAKKKLLENE